MSLKFPRAYEKTQETRSDKRAIHLGCTQHGSPKASSGCIYCCPPAISHNLYTTSPFKLPISQFIKRQRTGVGMSRETAKTTSEESKQILTQCHRLRL